MEEPPSSFENLTEKVLQLDREIRGEGWDHALPYVGPRTYFRFLESFCEIFKKKNSEAVAERASLRWVGPISRLLIENTWCQWTEVLSGSYLE